MHSHPNSKTDLEKIAEFVLSIGREIVRWNANFEPTEVKFLMQALSRFKVPDYVKEAFLKNGITPENYTTFEEIQNISVSVNRNGKAITKTIGQLITQVDSLPEKSTHHRDGTSRSAKELSENCAKNAALVETANCYECHYVCDSIWAECTPEVLAAFNLPIVNSTHTWMEGVNYVDVDGECIEDHCFNIINRSPTSTLTDVFSWIKNGENDKEVIITDLWKKPDKIISVNRELKLPPDQRSPEFQALLNNLERGGVLEVTTKTHIGEGHSKRWKDKKRDQFYFIHKKYPNVKIANQISNSNTFFESKKSSYSKHKKQTLSVRHSPYRRG